MGKLLPAPSIDPRSQLKGIGTNALAGNYVIRDDESGFISGGVGGSFVAVQWFTEDKNVSTKRTLVSVRALANRDEYQIYEDFPDFKQAETRNEAAEVKWQAKKASDLAIHLKWKAEQDAKREAAEATA